MCPAVVSLSLSHARVCLFGRKKTRHDMASALSSLSLSLLLQRQQRRQRKCKSKMTMVPKSLSATTNERSICARSSRASPKQNKGGGGEGRREGWVRGWVGGALGFFFFFFFFLFFFALSVSLFFLLLRRAGFFFFFFFLVFQDPSDLINVLWTYSDTVCF